jgi:hypothetical protein
MPVHTSFLPKPHPSDPTAHLRLNRLTFADPSVLQSLVSSRSLQISRQPNQFHDIELTTLLLGHGTAD